MREQNIKYKAIIAGTDDWIIGLPTRTYKDNYIDSILTDSGDSEYIRTDTLCRYTGYKDKTGNDIFTGDVIRQKIIDPVEPKGYYYWYATVDMAFGAFVLLQAGFDYAGKDLEEFTMLYSEADSIEVIGNIYDGKDYSRMNI